MSQRDLYTHKNESELDEIALARHREITGSKRHFDDFEIDPQHVDALNRQQGSRDQFGTPDMQGNPFQCNEFYDPAVQRMGQIHPTSGVNLSETTEGNHADFNFNSVLHQLHLERQSRRGFDISHMRHDLPAPPEPPQGSQHLPPLSATPEAREQYMYTSTGSSSDATLLLTQLQRNSRYAKEYQQRLQAEGAEAKSIVNVNHALGSGG